MMMSHEVLHVTKGNIIETLKGVRPIMVDTKFGVEVRVSVRQLQRLLQASEKGAFLRVYVGSGLENPPKVISMEGVAGSTLEMDRMEEAAWQAVKERQYRIPFNEYYGRVGDEVPGKESGVAQT